LVVANTSQNTIDIIENQSNGTFQAGNSYSVGLYPVSVIAFYVDTDNYLDLGACNAIGNNVTIFCNNQGGSFNNMGDYPTADGPYSIFAGDIDSDGDLDLVSADASSDSISVLFNLVGSSGIDKDNQSTKPYGFTLRQNYPNPFNTRTVIGYELKESQPIHIGVYDLLGREVEELYDGISSSGVHQFVWDASALSSGQYFVRLQTNAKSSVIRTTLIK
jgi:flagellar hook assembly protein FlgD